jgi:hypothetical protein
LQADSNDITLPFWRRWRLDFLLAILHHWRWRTCSWEQFPRHSGPLIAGWDWHIHGVKIKRHATRAIPTRHCSMQRQNQNSIGTCWNVKPADCGLGFCVPGAGRE